MNVYVNWFKRVVFAGLKSGGQWIKILIFILYHVLFISFVLSWIGLITKRKFGLLNCSVDLQMEYSIRTQSHYDLNWNGKTFVRWSYVKLVDRCYKNLLSLYWNGALAQLGCIYNSFGHRIYVLWKVFRYFPFQIFIEWCECIGSCLFICMFNWSIDVNCFLLRFVIALENDTTDAFQAHYSVFAWSKSCNCL